MLLLLSKEDSMHDHECETHIGLVLSVWVEWKQRIQSERIHSCFKLEDSGMAL